MQFTQFSCCRKSAAMLYFISSCVDCVDTHVIDVETCVMQFPIFYASTRPDWQVDAYCLLHVCPSVRSFVCLLTNAIFWKRWNRSWRIWARVPRLVHWKWSTLGVRMSKFNGDTSPKMDFAPGIKRCLYLLASNIGLENRCGHWTWRRPLRLSIGLHSAVVTIALSCTIFKLFDVQNIVTLKYMLGVIEDH